MLAELPPDIAASPLYNDDLAPTPASRRTCTTYNFAALWITMAHCLPTYMLAGGLIALGMNWWQALLTIALGNLIVLIPILLNAHPGTKYGIPFPVLARSSFGTIGANIPALLRAIVACGWFGIQTFIGGEAVRIFLTAVWPAFNDIGGGASILGLGVPSAITFGIFWLVNIGIIVFGMNAVRVFENWSAPLILLMGVWLMVWVIIRAGGLGPMFDRPSTFATSAEFWKVFVPSLTAMVGFWATLSLNIPDFTRFGRSQREQLLGQTLGLPITMIAFSAMAVVITSASQTILIGSDPQTLWDPVVLLSQITSSTAPPGLDAPLLAGDGTRILVALASLFGVAVATISTNIAANVISPRQRLRQLRPAPDQLPDRRRHHRRDRHSHHAVEPARQRRHLHLQLAGGLQRPAGPHRRHHGGRLLARPASGTRRTRPVSRQRPLRRGEPDRDGGLGARRRTQRARFPA